MPEPTVGSDLVRLLAAAGEGDRAAFERLYRATSPKLFGVTLRILHDRALAEEVLQEAYVRIWRNASRYDPATASPITWMAAIARNRAIDEARRVRPRGTEDASMLDALPDPAPSPARHAEGRQELRRLEGCLDELEAPRDEMVKLAYLDGLSREALAERFDQPVGTVKTWLRRSLLQLRACLDR